MPRFVSVLAAGLGKASGVKQRILSYVGLVAEDGITTATTATTATTYYHPDSGLIDGAHGNATKLDAGFFIVQTHRAG